MPDVLVAGCQYYAPTWWEGEIWPKLWGVFVQVLNMQGCEEVVVFLGDRGTAPHEPAVAVTGDRVPQRVEGL